MADLDLDAIESAARAATPGPWHADHDAITFDHRMMVTDADGEAYCDGEDGVVAEHATAADVAFLATCSPDVVLALVAEIRRLRDECAWLTRNLKWETGWRRQREPSPDVLGMIELMVDERARRINEPVRRWLATFDAPIVLAQEEEVSDV